MGKPNIDAAALPRRTHMTENVHEPGFFEKIAGFGKAYWVVNILELFERGAYYGMMSILARHMEKNLDFDSWAIGLLFSMLLILLYFVPIFSAALAEKYGYKETLLVAFALLGTGYFIFYFMETEVGFFLTILVMGTGAGAFKPMVSATVAHVTTKDQRNLGYTIYYWLINLGAFMVPLLLSFTVEEESYKWVFVFSGSIIALNMLITLIFFESPVERDPSRTVGSVLRDATRVLGDRRFTTLLIIYSGFWFMFSMNQSFLPLYMKNFHLMPEWFETTHLATINPGTIILIGPLLSMIIERFDSLKVMVLGIALFVFGFFLVGFFQISAIFVLGIFIFSIGEFITHPNFISYTSKIAPPDKVAMYMGYVFIPIGVGQTIGSFVGGFLYGHYAEDEQMPQIFWAIYCSVGLLTLTAIIIYHRKVGAAVRKQETEWEIIETPATPAKVPLYERLWNSPVYMVAALLMIPVLLGAAMAGDEREFFEEDEEGEWHTYLVSYERRTESTTQQAHVDDDETYTFPFMGEKHNLTSVRIEIRYSESEEFLGGGGLCDDVSANVHVPDEYETENSTTSGSQTDCNEDPDIVLTVAFDSDFTWEDEKLRADSADELRETLTIDRARGEWMVNVTVNVNDGSLVTDTGEDIEVRFIREYYEAEVSWN